MDAYIPQRHVLGSHLASPPTIQSRGGPLLIGAAMPAPLSTTPDPGMATQPIRVQ